MPRRKPSMDRKGRDDWQTPPPILDRVRKIGPIGFDPWSADSNPTGAALFCSKSCPIEAYDSNPNLSWAVGGITFINPMYGYLIAACVKRAMLAFEREPYRGIFVVPAACNTSWYHALHRILGTVCHPFKRVAFINPDTGLPQKGNDQAVIIGATLAVGPGSFEAAFRDYGTILSVRHGL